MRDEDQEQEDDDDGDDVIGDSARRTKYLHN